MNVKIYLINQQLIVYLKKMNQIKQLKSVPIMFLVMNLSNDEIFFNTPDASINIIKLTNNEENQSKQTKDQYQQNLIQPNIVYDHSNIEKIQFPPYHSAKRLNDQQKSQPLAKRQKKFILSENKNFEKNQKQIQLKALRIFLISHQIPKKQMKENELNANYL